MTPGQWFGCGRKTAYTAAGARKAAKRQAERWHVRREPYKCRYCDGWHLTKRVAA